MSENSKIPEEIIPFLKIILYFTFYISEVNEEKKSLTRYLRPEYLRKVIGTQKDDYEQALSWAVEHQDYEFRTVLPDIKFSNEDCLKLLRIFLSHIRAL